LNIFVLSIQTERDRTVFAVIPCSVRLPQQTLRRRRGPSLWSSPRIYGELTYLYGRFNVHANVHVIVSLSQL